MDQEKIFAGHITEWKSYIQNMKRALTSQKEEKHPNKMMGHKVSTGTTKIYE